MIFLGFDFDRMESVDDGAKHASYAHIAIHSAIMLVLEGIKWWTHFKGWRFIICLNEYIPLNNHLSFSFPMCFIDTVSKGFIRKTCPCNVYPLKPHINFFPLKIIDF